MLRESSRMSVLSVVCLLLSLLIAFCGFSPAVARRLSIGHFTHLAGDPTLPHIRFPSPYNISEYFSYATMDETFIASNRPGVRYLPSFGQLTPDTFLLFGGDGFHGRGYTFWLCDLWEWRNEGDGGGMWRFLHSAGTTECFGLGDIEGVPSGEFAPGVRPPGKQEAHMFPNMVQKEQDEHVAFGDRRKTPSEPPSASRSSSRGIDDSISRMYLWGGSDSSSDLWELDYPTRLWRRIHESSYSNVVVHPGEFSPLNRPGSRVGSSLWWWGDWWWGHSPLESASARAIPITDVVYRRSVVIFGGSGNDGDFNDVWELDLVSMSYELIRGSAHDSLGNYGPYSVENGNITLKLRGSFDDELDPPARYSPMRWAYGPDMLYIFGGRNMLRSLFFGDVWAYCRSLRSWKFVGGTPAVLVARPAWNYSSWGENQFTSDGTFDPMNLPTQRRMAFVWQLGLDTVLIFGGDKFDSTELYLFGDLWQFDIPSGEFACLQFCGGWNATRDRTYDPAHPHVIGARASGATFKDIFGNPALFGGFFAPNDVWSIRDMVETCRNVSVLESQWQCSSHGSCANESCSCSSAKYYGSDCQNWGCFGKDKSSLEVCSSHGSCGAADTCECSGFVGDRCENFTCWLVPPEDRLVCNGYGECMSADTCACDMHWFGDACQEHILVAAFSPSPRSVLKVSYALLFNLLDYAERYFSEFDCSLRFVDTSRFGTGATCTWVRREDLTSFLVVHLGDDFTVDAGDDVEIWLVTSPGVSVSVPVAEPTCRGTPVPCSGHGKCVPPGSCECSHGWAGKACDESICSECSSHGTCMAPDSCSCSLGWSGSACNDPVCGGTPICSGHGSCSAPSLCICGEGWTGDTCGTEIGHQPEGDNSTASSGFWPVFGGVLGGSAFALFAVLGLGLIALCLVMKYSRKRAERVYRSLDGAEEGNPEVDLGNLDDDGDSEEDEDDPDDDPEPRDDAEATTTTVAPGHHDESSDSDGDGAPGVRGAGSTGGGGV